MSETQLSPVPLRGLTRARMDCALPFIAPARTALGALQYPLPQKFDAPPPVTGGYDSFAKWTTKAVERLHHVVEVKNGFANQTGDVFDEGGRRMALASHKYKANPGVFGLQRNTFMSVKPFGAKPTLKYDGDVFVVTSSTSKLYYHGLLEIVPRLHLAQKMGMGPKVPVYVDASRPFMQECLRALKIDNIIDASRHTRVQANKLIVPCYEIGGSDCIPQWTISLLNALFPEAVSAPASQDRKIYLSRKQAGRRNIVNEQQVSAFLQSKGFETVFPENFSVQQQADMFRQAKFVAGPSGGAFTNIAFCKSGTTVLNVFHWQADNSIQKLCEAIGLRYAYVASRPSFNEKLCSLVSRIKIANRDISVNVQDMQRTFEKLV